MVALNTYEAESHWCFICNKAPTLHRANMQ